MKIALCAPFMEADLLEKRIRDAEPDEELRIDEYNSIDILLALPGLSLYEAVWVALPGAEGMEAIIRTRERDKDISLVWLSDDEEFAYVGVGYRLAMFLRPNSPPEEFRIAVKNCIQEKNGIKKRQKIWGLS